MKLKSRTTMAGVLSLCITIALYASGRESAQDIVDQVRSRQALVGSLQYSWTSTTVYPKGSFRELVSEPQPHLVESGFPEEDTEVQVTKTILIDGQKVRGDQAGVNCWSWVERRFVPDRFSSAYVGGVSRTYFAESKRGSIDSHSWTAGGISVYPILFAYRLFDPVLGNAEAGSIRVVGATRYEGQECIVVENPRRVGSVKGSWQRWWLAKDMGYCPVYWERLKDDGTAKHCISMHYEEYENIGWRLSSWETLKTYPEHGDVPLAVKSAVTEAQFNQAIDPDAFKIQFPVGTTVWDARFETESIVGEIDR